MKKAQKELKKIDVNMPTRNVLTGTIVNWDDEDMLSDSPGNLTLAWKDLSVYRRKKIQPSIWKSAIYEEVRVLHGLNGIVSSGNLVALMGSSGAGKTTLLAAISRRDKSAMTGYLMLNGRLAGADLIARISGFVPQEDLAIEDLTVAEHMEFMARMMMDRRSTKLTRVRRIQLLLSELGVNNCTRTKLKALSGGERKRVSLAVQLLNDPPILFCDEPTTGLDSWAAAAVVSRLRKLAAGGKLVVCSVHQPASGVFELFHQVVLLANGRIAFQGTIEMADQFFASLNYKCPMGFNAAEYYISLLGIEVDKEFESRERIRRICDEFQRSDIAAEIENRVGNVADENEYFNGTLDEKVMTAAYGHPQLQRTYKSVTKSKESMNEKDKMIEIKRRTVPPGLSLSERYTSDQYFEKYLTLVKVNYFVQFYWLMWRNIQSLKSNYGIWIAEFLLLMFVGLIISIPYSGRFVELDQRDIQNVEGLLYLTIAETIFLFIYAVFITFPSEVPILLRETASGLYAPLPYYLSKMIFWIPRAVIEPTLFTTLIFLVAGLRGGFMGWLGFNFICILCANYANAYGSFLSATFDRMETAALISVPHDLIGIMFSGIYLNLATAPPYFSWLRYISGFYYGTECVSVLQWNLVDTINCANAEGMPCIRTGAGVLKRFGFDEADFWINCSCLMMLYAVGNGVAYAMVVRRSKGTPVY